MKIALLGRRIGETPNFTQKWGSVIAEALKALKVIEKEKKDFTFNIQEYPFGGVSNLQACVSRSS